MKYKSAESWEDLKRVVDERPIEQEKELYGISRSVRGGELLVDLGNYSNEIGMIKLQFRTPKQAREAYGKGFRFKIKVVENPEIEQEM